MEAERERTREHVLVSGLHVGAPAADDVVAHWTVFEGLESSSAGCCRNSGYCQLGVLRLGELWATCQPHFGPGQLRD